jgi:hypothetical protein
MKHRHIRAAQSATFAGATHLLRAATRAMVDVGQQPITSGRRLARGVTLQFVMGRSELVHVQTPAPCSKHVLGEVKNVVPLSVVRVEEGLDMSPRALDRVPMSSSTKAIV